MFAIVKDDGALTLVEITEELGLPARGDAKVQRQVGAAILVGHEMHELGKLQRVLLQEQAAFAWGVAEEPLVRRPRRLDPVDKFWNGR